MASATATKQVGPNKQRCAASGGGSAGGQLASEGENLLGERGLSGRRRRRRRAVDWTGLRLLSSPSRSRNANAAARQMQMGRWEGDFSPITQVLDQLGPTVSPDINNGPPRSGPTGIVAGHLGRPRPWRISGPSSALRLLEAAERPPPTDRRPGSLSLATKQKVACYCLTFPPLRRASCRISFFPFFPFFSFFSSFIFIYDAVAPSRVESI